MTRLLPIDELLGSCFALAVGLTACVALNPTNPLAIGATVVGFALAALGALSLRATGALHAPRGRRFEYTALALLAITALLHEPVAHCPDGYFAAMCGFVALALGLLAVHFAGSPRQQRLALGVLVAGKLLLLFAAPLAVPRPPIDVWQLHQYAVDYVVHGQNPYTTAVPDLFGGHAAYGYQPYYPYPPLNLLLSIPARVLFGDYRYGLAAALALSLYLLRRSGALLGVAPRRLDVLTLAFVLHPQLERLVIHGWTEPYLVLAASAFVYFHVRSPGGAAEAMSLLALPLLKQYFAVPALLYLVLLRPRWRSLAIALGVVALAAAPLLAWNARATLDHGVLFLVQHVQFRGDSISIPAFLHARLGWESGAATALAAQVVVGFGAAAVVHGRGRGRGLGGYLLASALALFASFLVGPQAFINYYFFVGALVLLAAVATPVAAAVAPEPATSWGRAAFYTCGLGTAALVITVGFHLLDFQLSCWRAAASARVRLAAGAAVLDYGAVTARDDEAIFVCAAHDCFGPLCHEDLLCVCAPAKGAPADVGRTLDERGRGPASCTLDEAHPTMDDAEGACRKARCHEHLVEPR